MHKSPYDTPLPPGPSWNIPRISLPDCLGLLLQYQVEWWYYSGHAYDTDGMQYSLQFTIVRDALDSRAPELQLVACTSGIGFGDTYLWNPGYGIGVSQNGLLPAAFRLPKVTDDVYDGSFHGLLAPIRMRFCRTGGAPSGMKGSEYTLTSSARGDPAKNDPPYEIELQLVDERGMIMEWQSAFIGPEDKKTIAASSYEFAQPRLRITGGSLTIGETKHEIARGMLWLDRQVLVEPPPKKEGTAASTGDALQDAIAASSLSAELYRGDWMGITLDNGPTMALAAFWQPPPPSPPFPPYLQWQTGTLLGVPPLAANGNIYVPVDDGNEDVRRMRNGGSYLRGYEQGDPEGEFDFDINILTPDHYETSPHWTSSYSNRTYSSAWWIRFGPYARQYGVPENLYLKVISTGTENHLPFRNDFFEGAANVYADKELTECIGHAFVEQMGFN